MEEKLLAVIAGWFSANPSGECEFVGGPDFAILDGTFDLSDLARVLAKEIEAKTIAK